MEYNELKNNKFDWEILGIIVVMALMGTFGAIGLFGGITGIQVMELGGLAVCGIVLGVFGILLSILVLTHFMK